MNFIQHRMVRVLLVLCVRGTLCDVYIISLCKRCIGLMMTNAVCKDHETVLHFFYYCPYIITSGFVIFILSSYVCIHVIV